MPRVSFFLQLLSNGHALSLRTLSMFWFIGLCSTIVVSYMATPYVRRKQPSPSSASSVRLPSSTPFMDTIPDELVLRILSFLDLDDLIKVQLTSQRFSRIARDSDLWKWRCFDESPAEIWRRRTRRFLDATNRLSQLRNAVNQITEPSGATGTTIEHVERRALASWDPIYPGEHLDFYQEYIHRHAPVAPLEWFSEPKSGLSRTRNTSEVTGLGVLHGGSGRIEHVVAPMDDGSICLWEFENETRDGGINICAPKRSHQGLLTGSTGQRHRGKPLWDIKQSMTEVGAVECVSINSNRQRGLFSVQQDLIEVDLQTLQVVSSAHYPFPITALSDSSPNSPTTIGTKSTIHLFDSRLQEASSTSRDASIRCELIGGSTSYATLTQPGPLSILNHIEDDSIWVAGAFTHLLNYDRRFFPRLRGTVHSGARISCLSSIPHPHIPRELDLISNPTATISALETAKRVPGTTLIAGGVYKGKGSLELYGLSDSSIVSKYQNRQTAAISKMLSVIPHNGTIATSDSDGNIIWFERNAHHRIRHFNINKSPEQTHGSSDQIPSFNTLQTLAQQQLPHLRQDFSDEADRIDRDAPGQGDIVQKLVPMSTFSSSSSSVQNPLIIWTGDGRLGALGYGKRSPFTQIRDNDDGEDEGYGSSFSGGESEEEEWRRQARKVEARAREDAERQYAGRMRRALEGQASEARWMRGLGLGG